jgi:hypothetical protein
MLGWPLSSRRRQRGILNEDISLDAPGAGGGIPVGTWLHPRWTLDLGADAGSTTTLGFDAAIDLSSRLAIVPAVALLIPNP